MSQTAARIYLATQTRFTAAQRLLQGVFVGVWLGVLDRAALAAVDAHYYARQREPVGDRALPYGDPGHIFSGLFDWERAAVDAHFPAGGRVVVTGAGAGREVASLRDLGFEADGFEPNAAMRDAGARAFAAAGRPERIAACERDAFPATAAADAVVVGWTSISHMPTRAGRVAFLRGARAVLPPGGHMLVSYWNRPAQDRYMRVVWRVSSVVRRLLNREATEFGDVLAPLFVHCFDAAGIEAELRLAGFEPIVSAIEPYPHTVARVASSSA